MQGIEEVGAAVTGGLIARAVEPGAGESHGQGAGPCANCQTPLTGPHCSQCGQAAHVHRSLGAFWHDLAHSVLHFEGKIWRTLPMLAWHPGALTRRYIMGERARFVSPMALFLFSVFAMFATVSAIGGPFDLGIDPSEFRNTSAQTAAALESNKADLKELQEERAEDVRDGNAGEVRGADVKIRRVQQVIRALEAAQDPETSKLIEPSDGTTGWERLDKGLKKLNENPSLALYKVQNNAYKFSWLLIPLSVPFVWLLFPFRRGTHLYDHTVFVTYSLSFMTLLMVLLSFLRLAGAPDSWIGSAFFFLPPIHMYRQLRGAYLLRRRSAAWRTMLLFVFANIALTLFVTLLVFLGAIG